MCMRVCMRVQIYIARKKSALKYCTHKDIVKIHLKLESETRHTHTSTHIKKAEVGLAQLCVFSEWERNAKCKIINIKIKYDRKTCHWNYVRR